MILEVVSAIILTAVSCGFGYYLGSKQRRVNPKNLNKPLKCDGCCNIAFRYPCASMYPCISCVRANQRDYYNVEIKE
jgi:hypothetical protein